MDLAFIVRSPAVTIHGPIFAIHTQFIVSLGQFLSCPAVQLSQPLQLLLAQRLLSLPPNVTFFIFQRLVCCIDSLPLPHWFKFFKEFTVCT